MSSVSEGIKEVFMLNDMIFSSEDGANIEENFFIPFQAKNEQQK